MVACLDDASSFLREVATELLPSVSADTPLMEASLKSQQAVHLAARLHEQIGMEVSATLVFEHPTPRSIAAHVLDSASIAVQRSRRVHLGSPRYHVRHHASRRVLLRQRYLSSS